MHWAKIDTSKNGGKTAGVSSDAAHDGGVFIVDFTPDQAMTECSVIFGGRDSRL